MCIIMNLGCTHSYILMLYEYNHFFACRNISYILWYLYYIYICAHKFEIYIYSIYTYKMLEICINIKQNNNIKSNGTCRSCNVGNRHGHLPSLGMPTESACKVSYSLASVAEVWRSLSFFRCSHVDFTGQKGGTWEN